jgi:hypothetical protein
LQYIANAYRTGRSIFEVVAIELRVDIALRIEAARVVVNLVVNAVLLRIALCGFLCFVNQG